MNGLPTANRLNEFVCSGGPPAFPKYAEVDGPHNSRIFGTLPESCTFQPSSGPIDPETLSAVGGTLYPRHQKIGRLAAGENCTLDIKKTLEDKSLELEQRLINFILLSKGTQFITGDPARWSRGPDPFGLVPINAHVLSRGGVVNNCSG